MADFFEMYNVPKTVEAGGKKGNGKAGRHSALWEFGLKLRGINLPAKQIIKEMEQYNEESCVPPISKYDLDRLVLSVLKWEFK